MDNVTRTSDYAPVKHGKWTIITNNRINVASLESVWAPLFKCSECGFMAESYVRFDEPVMPEDADGWRYCPYCGARMDGGENDKTD